MEKFSINVNGMSCEHCERAVKNALEDLGATAVAASVANANVTGEHDPAKLSLDKIKAEITEIGYILA
ncbi:MAG: cation transporter [Defluviitaleaceae bacterium]|nr:cation transporter [Defluviitaleaceae bacterium]